MRWYFDKTVLSKLFKAFLTCAPSSYRWVDISSPTAEIGKDEYWWLVLVVSRGIRGSAWVVARKDPDVTIFKPVDRIYVFLLHTCR